MSNAAADQVMDLIFGRWRSQTLSAGTELGVFDHLDKETPKKPERLAVELGVDPALLYRLLRAQATIGLLAEDASRGFVLTEAGNLLRTAHPESLSPMARLEEGPQHYALWKHLPAMVRDGKQNAFVREFDRMAFDYALDNPDYAQRFKQAMSSYSAVQSSLVLEALRDHDFSRIRNFCDVAGGYGHLMCALLEAHPDLTGIVFDLPRVVRDVDQLWASRLALQARCTYVGGDRRRSHLHRRARSARTRRFAFLQAVRHPHDVLGHWPGEDRGPIQAATGGGWLEASGLPLPG